MSTKLSAYRHQILASALSVLALAAGYALIVAPALAARAEYRERVDALQNQYPAFEQAALEVPRLQEEIDAILAREDRDAGLFEPMPAALAAAELQRRVASLSEQYGGTLISTQVVSDRTDSSFPKVAIKVRMRSNVRSMTEIFRALTSSTPVLFLEGVTIQSQNLGRAPPGQSSAALLDVQFDVVGYMYRQAES